MHANHYISDWLPTSAKEVEARQWEQLDVILFTGDAYIDHPAFGIAVLGRVLESAGFRVAVVPQPNWQDDLRDFSKLGRPRYFFGVSAGAMDSMVTHYTARKRRRSTDAYTPGNVSGFRPDYPSIVYTKALQKLFPDVPVILGGVEASLRRFTHYDYWQDNLKRSILLDSGADMIIYGMGEKALLKITALMEKGVAFSGITDLKQTAVARPKIQRKSILDGKEYTELFDHEECLSDKKKFAKNFARIETASNIVNPDILTQNSGDMTVIVNPPNPVMTEKELDRIYDLPYTRLPHPRYRKKRPVPAYEMIRHSVNTHRGCFGGCSFCTISAHQGKFVQSRSPGSILREIKSITKMPDFKGHITDMGGPSANMYQMRGHNEGICEVCSRPSCLYPSICRNLNTDHRSMTELYRNAAMIEGVNRITIGSGLRYDFLNEDENKNHFREYFHNLVKHHVSGRLKVAPEHTARGVLKTMRKPDYELFRKLVKEFNKINDDEGLNQQIIPYFISGYPDCRLQDMAELAVITKKQGLRLEQVQDFTPTPMTLATVMYYSGYDPYTLEKVITAKSGKERANQVMFFFWYKKEFKSQIRNELIKLGRHDLLEQLLGK
ncbi:MAG: YgiQ family radical SAM protein [Bacteroidales bacterium]|nr:YgiQ family radical SAM protein [Bacteroidales bacterium]